MNPLDLSTLAAIERCYLAGDTTITKALNAAYELGRLAGQLEQAKIGEGMVKDAFGPALDAMRGKVKTDGA
jgi:hypothetical protein